MISVRVCKHNVCTELTNLCGSRPIGLVELIRRYGHRLERAGTSLPLLPRVLEPTNHSNKAHKLLSGFQSDIHNVHVH
jgi:hypothetical protein